jgi:O-antigen/teichoic acid export membrane protein
VTQAGVGGGGEGRRGIAKRAGWGLGDQALSSLTNFALGITVARTVGPADFGAFSLAFATYVMVMGVSNALAAQPLVIRFSTVSEERWRSGTRSATGAALLLGLLTGAVCVVAGLLLDGALGRAFLGLGIALPGLLLQDTWRFAFFAAARGGAAFTNDAVWAAVLLPLLAVLAFSGVEDVLWFVLAWGLAGGAGALVGIWQARLVPEPRAWRRWWHVQRDLSRSFIGEFLASTGSKEVALFGVGGVAGLATVGALRAGQILLGPLQVFFRGIYLIAVPEAVRVLRRSPDHFRRILLLMSAGMSSVALVVGVALLAVPDAIGEFLLRDTWSAATPVILPLVVVNILAGVFSGANVGLRALEAARTIFHARLVMGAASVVLKITGASIAGAAGAAWGSAGGTGVGATVFWLQLRRTLRARRPDGAEPTLAPVAGPDT